MLSFLFSVQFISSVMSDSLQPHEPQHAWPPCPLPTPGVHPNLCPLSHPLLLLPSIFPSIRVFSNESALCIRWPKYWSFSFNISPSKEHQSLLQHHSSKASILWRSDFFTVQLSHPYMTTGKTIALTRRKLVGKVMSLLLNTLSKLVITFFQGVSVF